MWIQFHLEFFIFKKMLNTQNQTLVTTTYVHVSVIALYINWNQTQIEHKWDLKSNILHWTFTLASNKYPKMKMLKNWHIYLSMLLPIVFFKCINNARKFKVIYRVAHICYILVLDVSIDWFIVVVKLWLSRKT
jgi:hypothetical protein